MALQYHHGQIEVQTEANTRPVAEMLAGWVGPVGEFCRTADLIVLAVPGTGAPLEFLAVSGEAPVVEVAGPPAVIVRLDDGQAPDLPEGVSCGGIAISLAMARRARLNGVLRHAPGRGGLLLEANEAFTNCRKYIAPSVALSADRHVGPYSRQDVPLSDPWLTSVLASAETSFLASVSPDGTVDVSHRGGPPGFLRLDPTASVLAWDEFVGDGMFKSAGNIRATGTIALLVPDLASGDAVELLGAAQVHVSRRDRRPRADALLHQREEYPVQGGITCRVTAAYRLHGLTHPRERLERRQRVTSASPVQEQYPQ